MYTFDPRGDSRWATFVQQHPAASVFHTLEWAEALERTYGYQPIVLTTSPPDRPLANGILFCRVKSWLTGKRLVSVPFADHCEPLVDTEGDRSALWAAVLAASQREGGYVELRPKSDWLHDVHSATAAASYWLHALDLAHPLEELWRRFHESTVRRKIRRALREELRYEEGTSPAHVAAFYQLMLLTRRRHGLAPQPIEWFSNLVNCLNRQVTIRLLSRDGSPVAGIMTLRHAATVTYKYAASDPRFHPHGSMQLLLWRTIQEAHAAGAASLDFGRSDRANVGLSTFKERWGATATSLSYVRIGPGGAARGRKIPGLSVMPFLARHLPDRMLIAAGRLLYPHLG